MMPEPMTREIFDEWAASPILFGSVCRTKGASLRIFAFPGRREFLVTYGEKELYRGSNPYKAIAVYNDQL